jgi:hypothetical protein
MKKAIKAIAAFAAFVFAFAAFAATEKVGSYTWTYKVYNDDTVEIYNGGDAAVSPLPTGALTIPTSLGGKTKIRLGAYIFKGCTGLKRVTIHAKVTFIDYDAFSSCSGLESFSVTGSGTDFSAVNGLLLSGKGKRLLHGVNGDVTIPDGVEIIRKSAFDSLSGLNSVTIPDTVTNIGTKAFSGCSKLSILELPYNVETIAKDALSGCTSLKTLCLPHDNFAGKAISTIVDLSDCPASMEVRYCGSYTIGSGRDTKYWNYQIIFGKGGSLSLCRGTEIKNIGSTANCRKSVLMRRGDPA